MLSFLGEVALHRLTWQKVWSLNAIQEGDSVSSIAWSPDGKMIAITYEVSKKLCIVDIENKHILHTGQLFEKCTVKGITWLPLIPGESLFPKDDESSGNPLGDYLPPLPSLNRSFNQEPGKTANEHTNGLDMLFVSNLSEFFFFCERKNFVKLLVNLQITDTESNVFMYVFGKFFCGFVNLHSPVLDISGGSGNPIWATTRLESGIQVNRLSSCLLETDKAFFKVYKNCF